MASSDQFQPPPTTRRQDLREILHGVEVPDPYRWLEDGAAPETRAWLSAQHEYASPFFDTPERENIHSRLAQLMRGDAIGIPIELQGYYLYSRRRADEQRNSICRRLGLHGVEEILVDGNALSSDQMISVEIVGVSFDGSVVAYGRRRGGEDEFSIHLMDVKGRRDLPDELPRARYGDASWKHGGSGFYYTVRTDQGPRIRFHRVDTSISEDREILGSDWGPERWAYASVSDDGRYLLTGCGYRTASTSSGDRNALYFQQLDPEVR